MSDLPTLLAQIPALKSGSHRSLKDGACIMEAVSFIAGEPWSDSPACACPVIAAFLRKWNDNLDDADRNEMLRPLIPRLVGTRGSAALEQRRATMAADWLIRVYTPAWLWLAKLETQAVALESLPEITDFARCPSLMPTLTAVRNDAVKAWTAAWAAAGYAARDAAWAAAGDTAWAAAWTAAGYAAGYAAGDAAWDAAWTAAGYAAGYAAGDAAWDAAGDALKPTKRHLQQSALVLVNRMIDATEEA